MKRVVEMKDVASVLDSVAEIEYNVAISRNEDLFYVQKEIDERIFFLYLIGLVNNKEREKMLQWSEDLYKQKLKEKEEKQEEKKDLLDVGFDF